MPKFTPETALTGHEAGGPCGPADEILFSDSGGLTQFGAFVEMLPPGSSSALKHWHANEDEMVYMLEGAATVLEGDDSYPLGPGEAATFKAGTPVGHCLVNCSDAPIRYLVIGTRAASDTVTYPDHDRILRHNRGDSGEVESRSYTRFDGTPSLSAYED
ncbi:MAG: cupin [Yangia sp.]|nr:cupin [Salipiger sp.]